MEIINIIWFMITHIMNHLRLLRASNVVGSMQGTVHPISVEFSLETEPDGRTECS